MLNNIVVIYLIKIPFGSFSSTIQQELFCFRNRFKKENRIYTFSDNITMKLGEFCKCFFQAFGQDNGQDNAIHRKTVLY